MAIPEVRSLLVERQREYNRREPVVMEGRDIGTVVSVSYTHLDHLFQAGKVFLGLQKDIGRLGSVHAGGSAHQQMVHGRCVYETDVLLEKRAGTR